MDAGRMDSGVQVEPTKGHVADEARGEEEQDGDELAHASLLPHVYSRQQEQGEEDEQCNQQQ